MPFKVKPYQHLGSTSIYIHVRHVSDSLTCSSPVHEVTVHYILSRTELMTQCYTSTSTCSELKKHKRVFVGIKPSKQSTTVCQKDTTINVKRADELRDFRPPNLFRKSVWVHKMIHKCYEVSLNMYLYSSFYAFSLLNILLTLNTTSNVIIERRNQGTTDY